MLRNKPSCALRPLLSHRNTHILSKRDKSIGSGILMLYEKFSTNRTYCLQAHSYDRFILDIRWHFHSDPFGFNSTEHLVFVIAHLVAIRSLLINLLVAKNSDSN